MLNKYILWIYIFCFSLMSFVLPTRKGDKNEIKKWVISENSSLRVNGSTNVNTFTCEIPDYDKTDTLTLSPDNNRGIILSGSISLNVQNFDCHNIIMTHDLRKTLKADKFPVLRINFLSLNKIPGLTARPEAITGLVDIEIAGVKKRFEVNYRIGCDAGKIIHMVGSREVNFSDFNLVPPRKLGGMIRTNDKLSVDFHLAMTPID